jgi:hypothetical protein
MCAGATHRSDLGRTHRSPPAASDGGAGMARKAARCRPRISLLHRAPMLDTNQCSANQRSNVYKPMLRRLPPKYRLEAENRQSEQRDRVSGWSGRRDTAARVDGLPWIASPASSEPGRQSPEVGLSPLGPTTPPFWSPNCEVIGLATRQCGCRRPTADERHSPLHGGPSRVPSYECKGEL